MAEAGYNTLDDLAAEGVDVSNEDRVKKIGQAARNYIEKITGRQFEARTDTLKIDWKPKERIVLLPEFAMSVTEIRVMGMALDSHYFTLYNRVTPGQDDRNDPRISLESGWTGRNPDRSPYRSFEFPHAGDLNRLIPQAVEVDGSFGYCDPVRDEDGQITGWETPWDIQRIHAILVARLLPAATDADARDNRRRERIVHESVDGHAYTLNAALVRGSITGDPDIDTILSFYTAPLRMGSA